MEEAGCCPELGSGGGGRAACSAARRWAAGWPQAAALAPPPLLLLLVLPQRQPELSYCRDERGMGEDGEEVSRHRVRTALLPRLCTLLHPWAPTTSHIEGGNKAKACMANQAQAGRQTGTAPAAPPYTPQVVPQATQREHALGTHRGFSFLPRKRASRDTPDTFTTLKRTPGISPTAWPRRPKPAISTSSCG